jgi:hypothetical protein
MADGGSDAESLSVKNITGNALRCLPKPRRATAERIAQLAAEHRLHSSCIVGVKLPSSDSYRSPRVVQLYLRNEPMK